MSIDQSLNKLQRLINETLPSLELFVDETIQATSDDCQKLSEQLNQLQEQLSIYKYLKSQKEISPSFNIHSKISSIAVVESEKDEIVEGLSNNESPAEITQKQEDPIPESFNAKNSSKKVELTLNQKFQIINELFQQNNLEFSTAIDQINNCSNLNDAEIYLANLKSIYSWNENSETYKMFISVVNKRF